MRYQAQTVVIAGSQSDLGHALVAAFLAEGAQVFALGMESAHSQDGIQDARYVQTNLMDAASVQAGVQQIVAQTGQIDVLVTNMLLPMPAEVFLAASEISPTLWDDHQRRFYGSVYYTNHAVGKVMLERGQGAIVNLAPVDGLFAQQHRASYAAAAAGVFMLTKALAVEWAAMGLRVNAIACGVLPHAQPDSSEPIADETYLSRIPMGRRATYQEFTDAVLFAAGEEASFVTGEVIRVDGGWTAYHLFFPFEGAF